MSVLHVGPSSTHASIAEAMTLALPGDTIALEDGYSGETAIVTESGIILRGDASNTGITLRLADGVGSITVSGAAPVNVLDSVSGPSTEANSITGGSGNNVITVSGGVDAVDGGLGTDRLVVNYAAAQGAVTGDSTSNFTDAGGGRTVTITAGTFEHFTITTGNFADTITTGVGHDNIDVGNGANTVTAGAGNNTITGGSGADTFTTLGGADYMNAGKGANVLTSGEGNDTIISGSGADTIVTGGGNDRITVRGGADSVSAGAQDDLLIMNYGKMDTAVTGTLSGTAEIGHTGHFADQTTNRVDFSGVERFSITSGSGADDITTGGGADKIKSGAGADLLRGMAGDDTLDGGSGNDTLEGGAGNDRLTGGDGNDRLIGGQSKDFLSGGAGADVFVFQSTGDSGITASTRDVIRDGFTRGVDTIDVSAIDANAGIVGNQAFVLDQNDSFSQGEIRQTVQGNGLLVEFNTDSDVTAEMSFLIKGLTAPLVESDFLF